MSFHVVGSEFTASVPCFTQAVSEKDFLDAVQKVIKGYAKFSSTPTYMVYN